MTQPVHTSLVPVAQLAKTSAPDPTQAFEPRGIEEAMRLAKLLVSSRLLPRSVTTPEAAFAIIATGRELGMTAMQSLRSIHVVEGKPTLSADLIAALVKSRSDVCKYFMLVESTVTAATYETLRNGDPQPTRLSFTMDDAARAGLTGKDNWRKYPAAMLRARCITALARAVYPDLALGIYDEDELEPIAQGPAQRWVEPEPQEVQAQDGEQVFFALGQRVDAAETAAELNSIAKDTMAARRAGVIGEGQVDLIASAVKAKRGLIGAPPPPASEPKVEQDADESRQPGED